MSITTVVVGFTGIGKVIRNSLTTRTIDRNFSMGVIKVVVPTMRPGFHGIHFPGHDRAEYILNSDGMLY